MRDWPTHPNISIYYSKVGKCGKLCVIHKSELIVIPIIANKKCIMNKQYNKSKQYKVNDNKVR